MDPQQLRYWRRLVWLAAGLHGVLTLTLALTRLHTGKAGLLDIGFYDQAIWTAFTNGTPTISTYPPYEARHFFTLHFVPLVLLLAPVYPRLPLESLIVVQSLLVSASAVIVFHAVLQMKVQPRAAFTWTLVYLLNPFLMNGAVWDFRERSMALPLIATAFVALGGRKPALFAGALAALALCQEHFGLAIFGFGLLWAHEHGRDKVGIPIAAGGLVVLAVVALVMTGLKPAGESTPLVGGSLHVDRYSWLMKPPAEWLPTLGALIPQGAAYVLCFLAIPFVGLSLLSPVFLLPGLADLAANLLSSNPMPRSLYAYHSMTLVPVFLMAAVRTSARWSDPAKWARAALVVTLPFTYATFPASMPGAADTWRIDSIVLSRDPAIHEIGQLLDPSMSVSVQNGIGVFFSRRTSVYTFPTRMQEVDAVILHVAYPYADVHHAPFSIPYSSAGDLGVGEMGHDVLPATQRLLEDRRYGVVYWKRNWLLAVRGAADQVDRRLVQNRVDEFQKAFTAREQAGP